ncbi:hypothetical protein HYDPIDRAFT_180293 [Hydnomerulius pinastri MD-312]|nr:hypothetical protein HYDPIDRAFT_180293 [Hydnomerulius pinastri MD-312]
MSKLQRKYVDLIHQTSSKYANWDPPIPVEVGAYGTLDRGTGELNVEGNIYDPDFQEELDKVTHGRLRLADYPPELGGVEADFVVKSSGVRERDFKVGPEVGFAGLASASLKGEWQFGKGKRDALLVMHSPRQKYIPPKVILEHLYKVPNLKDKYLVTSVFVCPAFSMYLSNKSGEKLSLALMAAAPVAAAAGITAGGEIGFGWWTDVQSTMFRKACDKDGEYRFTPLYALKRRREGLPRLFRDKLEAELEGDKLWDDALPPWDPLDSDGEEDPIDVVRTFTLFNKAPRTGGTNQDEMF